MSSELGLVGEARVGVSVVELVRALLALGDLRRHPADVSRLLMHRRLLHPSLRPYLQLRPHRYTRNLVFRNDAFEVLVLCWAAGTRSPVHDHGGQQCWFAPLVGAFDLEDFEIVAGRAEPGPARLVHAAVRRTVTDVDHRGGAEVHRVSVSAGTEVAVSLHVYAGPIDECLVYELERERCARRRLRYDTVGGVSL